MTKATLQRNLSRAKASRAPAVILPAVGNLPPIMNSQPVAPKRGRPRAVDNDTLATFTRISEVSGRSGTGFTTSENYQDPLFEAYQVTCRSKGEPVPDASPYNARNALAAVKATHSHTRKNTDQRNARRAEALRFRFTFWLDLRGARRVLRMVSGSRLQPFMYWQDSLLMSVTSMVISAWRTSTCLYYPANLI